MRVTPPILITPAKLTSSSASEPHAPSAYNAGTTYALGAIVSVAADFQIYESLAASNTGNTPLSSPLWWRILGPTETAYDVAHTYALGDTCSANHRCYESQAAGNTGNPVPVLPETTTTKWLDVGPTNKWAAFDLSRNTQTVWSSPLTMVVAPGQRINTVGLTGMVANTAVISATSVLGGGTVYGPTTFDLNSRVVLDGYDYCFEPFSTNPSQVVFDMPPYSDIIITITLSSTSGNVKCGSVVLGTYIYIGNAIGKGSNQGQNYSTVTRDLYANATLVPRRTVPKLSVITLIDSYRIGKVLAARDALNAKPALWTGLDDSTSDFFEMTTILGVYQTLDPETIEGVDTKAQITVVVEEI